MSQYVQEAVRNVEEHLRKGGLALIRRVITPISVNYSPGIDSSAELDAEDATYYQSLIGVL